MKILTAMVSDSNSTRGSSDGRTPSEAESGVSADVRLEKIDLVCMMVDVQICDFMMT